MKVGPQSQSLLDCSSKCIVYSMVLSFHTQSAEDVTQLSFCQIFSKDIFLADNVWNVVSETKNSKVNKANFYNQRMHLNVYRCNHSQTGRKVLH